MRLVAHVCEGLELNHDHFIRLVCVSLSFSLWPYNLHNVDGLVRVPSRLISDCLAKCIQFSLGQFDYPIGRIFAKFSSV